jgi:hypothetical protein
MKEFEYGSIKYKVSQCSLGTMSSVLDYAKKDAPPVPYDIKLSAICESVVYSEALPGEREVFQPISEAKLNQVCLGVPHFFNFLFDIVCHVSTTDDQKKIDEFLVLVKNLTPQ